MTPDRLGPYRIERKLGAGGMGDVLAGVHDETGELAALKVLPAHLAKQPGFRSRFEVEIETLRRLDHPHIVRILGFGQQGDILFYAMELALGASLDTQVDQGKALTWQEVIALALQLCKALKHAHDRGIIHRDIKPANLLLLDDGQVKLADFGIAQLYGVSGLTVDGGIVGTASYLSPEQADGDKATPRSDLYSLGATLYALLTGRPPFVAQTLPELLRLQRTAEPTPPSQLGHDLPRELDPILLGLLAKAPQDRIATATMLAKSLQAAQAAIDLRITRQAGPPPSPAVPDATPSDENNPSQATQAGSPPASPAADLHATLASPPATPSHVDATQASPASQHATMASVVPASSPSDRTAASLTPDGPSAASSGIAAQPPASPSSADTGTFLTAEQAADRDRQRQEEDAIAPPRVIPVGPILLVVAGLLLVVAVIILLRPPSADTLYSRIMVQAEQDTPAAMPALAEDLDEFRHLYPDDPRLAELATLEQRVARWRQSRLRPLAQRMGMTPTADSPLAQLYQQAMAIAPHDPQTALGQLEAILTLYGSADTLTEDEQAWLADIRTQRDALQSPALAARAAHVLLIRKHLSQATQLQTTQPDQARAIAQAIVDLYADKPWAADLIQQARTIISPEAPEASGTPTSP